MTNLGNNIKQARKRKNITQKELAELLGVKVQTVLRWEKGEREPSIETIQKMMQILETSQLIDGANKIGGKQQMISFKLGYWGDVVDNAKQFERSDASCEEKKIVKTLLKSAYNAITIPEEQNAHINSNMKINNEQNNHYGDNIIN